MRRIIFIFLFLAQSFVCLSQENINLSVYFRLNKHSLGAVYKNKIDSTMQNHQFTAVYIKAHCDSLGSDDYNDALSLKRADEVKRYLVAKKISGNIIDIKAFGRRSPLTGNENARGKALNRRVEILFVVSDSSIRKPDVILENVDAPNDSVIDSGTLSHDTAASPDTVMTHDTALPHDTIVSHDTDLPRDTTTLSVDSIEVGETFVLENMNFLPGKHVLLPKSNKTLRHLLNTLRANPALEIEIQGHICCEQSGDGLDFDTNTRELSVNRAKAIYDYLVQRGINSSRLSHKGFGSSRKLVTEVTEADRSTNRRVEIKVLKK